VTQDKAMKKFGFKSNDLITCLEVNHDIISTHVSMVFILTKTPSGMDGVFVKLENSILV